MGSETLASPSAEVWISFLFPHHSVLTSSVSHFCNDCQVQGRIFFFFPHRFFFFLSSGNVDSFICEKCLCVFDFGLRYLTLGSAGLNSSHFLALGDTEGQKYLKCGFWATWKKTVQLEDLSRLKYTIWFVMLVQSKIHHFWDWTELTSFAKSVRNEGCNDPNGSKRLFSSDFWNLRV